MFYKPKTIHTQKGKKSMFIIRLMAKLSYHFINVINKEKRIGGVIRII